jgi:hypothetical protein
MIKAMLSKIKTLTALAVLVGFGLFFGHTALCQEHQDHCQICKFASSLGHIDIFPDLFIILPLIAVIGFFAFSLPISAGAAISVIRAPPVLLFGNH